MVRILIVLLLFLNAGACLGQPNALYFHQLTAEEGLSQSTNDFLYTDRLGYTWVGSMDGLNRFDGKTVTVYKSDPNDPRSLKGVDIQSSFFEDAQGNLWFTTGAAINCFIRNGGYFLHDFAPGRDSTQSGVHFAFFLEQDRYLWVTAQDNLYRYDTHAPGEGERTPVLGGFKGIRCTMITDALGRVRRIFSCFWDNMPGFEIIDFSEQGAVIARKTWFDRAGNPGPRPLVIKEAIADKNGGAWFASNEGLLFFDDQNPEKFKTFNPYGKDLNVSSFIRVSDQQLWITDAAEELWAFDQSKPGFLPQPIPLFNLDNKNKISRVDKLFPVSNGVFWVSSEGAGAYFAHVANHKFTSLYPVYGLSQHSSDQIFEAPGGEIWCLSDDGNLRTFNPQKKWIAEKTIQKYPRLLTDPAGQTWSISAQGVCKLTANGTWKAVLIPKNSLILYEFIDFKNRFLFIGTNDGIYLYDKSKNTLKKAAGEGILNKVYLDKMNRLWTANVSDELMVWEITDQGNCKRLQIFKDIGIIQHIIDDALRKVIWVGSSKGLIKIEGDSLQMSLITEADGLPNQFIYAVMPDRAGRIWLSSNKGIIRYNPEDPPATRYQNFGSRDGLSADEYLPGAVLYSRTNEIWFGSTQGVDVFDPDHVKAVGGAPKLGINSLKIHDQEWKGDTSITLVRQVALKHKQNTLTFELAALEFIDPVRNSFKVYLHHSSGTDSSFLGPKNSITYANLSPGKYRFQFSAANAEGIWQPNKHSLDIVISPPYYQTWWFRGMVIIAVLGFVSFASAFYYRYQLRAKQLELEREKHEAERKQLVLEKELSLQIERNRIAKEMHDELGGGLSTIRNASERGLKREDILDVKHILARVSQISNNLIDNVRGIIWAMDTHNDSLRSLVAYIRNYTRVFLDDNGLQADVRTPESLPESAVNGHFRHNIHLVVKELLHNILKHANAGKVEFELSLADQQIKIVIRDDGQGFDPDEKFGSGVGLRSMTKRMESINGRIAWQRRPDKGMEVNLSAPLNSTV